MTHKIEYVMPFSKDLQEVLYSNHKMDGHYLEYLLQLHVIILLVFMESAFLMPIMFNLIGGGFQIARLETLMSRKRREFENKKGWVSCCREHSQQCCDCFDFYISSYFFYISVWRHGKYDCIQIAVY